MALAVIDERLLAPRIRLDPDFSDEGLNRRIEALRTGWAGHQALVRSRNRAFLRAYSPAFDEGLGELDQWPEVARAEDAGHTRSSYNLTRAVVELWSALEMSEFPAIRWFERYLPTPVPSLDAVENARRLEVYRASKLVGRQVATMREQALMGHVRRSKLSRHTYRAVTKKNIYGLSWVKSVPDLSRRSFTVFSNLDPSTVYPVYSSFGDDRLDAILVAYRRSVQSVNAQYPGFVETSSDGLTAQEAGFYYMPSADRVNDADRRFVWVEDYWALDDAWTEEVSDDAEPIASRVVNCVRINGRIAQVAEYPGWRAVPYVSFGVDNERDPLGFSDVATMLPIQDGVNRFMSQQQDVIFGESRPRFKFRGDADRQLTFSADEVVSLEPEEDIEQIQVRLDVFPTQIHGQQLMDMLARATGLPDVVFGRIVAAQNSGRALATAWRAVAARMVPRTNANSTSIERLLGPLWLDWMELYGWDNARDLYAGNRDFELDFPNQEPRDFQEVALNAVNKLNAGIIDLQQAMEDTGERSPDEMLERVRADYMDAVLHPEKSQSYLLLTRLKNQIAIEAQQAGIQAATAEAQLAALAGSPPGGAPGAGTPDQQAGAAAQARTQAQQQAAPQLAAGQNAPGAQAGGPANTGKTEFSTLAQDGGPAQNRIIDRGTIA